MSRTPLELTFIIIGVCFSQITVHKVKFTPELPILITSKSIVSVNSQSSLNRIHIIDLSNSYLSSKILYHVIKINLKCYRSKPKIIVKFRHQYILTKSLHSTGRRNSNLSHSTGLSITWSLRIPKHEIVVHNVRYGTFAYI